MILVNRQGSCLQQKYSVCTINYTGDVGINENKMNASSSDFCHWVHNCDWLTSVDGYAETNDGILNGIIRV